ncbi:allantoinase [Kyrpidia sp.]|uniref:allantoinase n=1 Tax=Kyrpidia sp. TaxID=2073077 RepID=UPI002585EE57|nr:allantoinase [Kyrpidia sp.]MCL6576502.1 allantoinase [Kyrpidia sp.]
MRDEGDLVIRGGTVVSPEGTRRADLRIRHGTVVAMESQLTQTSTLDREIDATGLYIFPGLIDAHVHLNEPGRADWEGFTTGTMSLAAGGVTTFFDMPLNSTPPVTVRSHFEEKRKVAEAKSFIDYGLWGGLIPGNAEELTELSQCGAIGFKAFMTDAGTDDFPAVDNDSLWAGMDIAARLGAVVAVHAESSWITRRLTESFLSQGRVSARDYEASRPVVSELEAVERALAIARLTGCRLHVVHASSADVVRRIRAAREAGVDVSVETCPHYLSLTVADLEELGGVAKCAPPLRGRDEVEALWQAVRAGLVDTVGSDHSPCPPSMKEDPEGNLFRVWGGISGAQTALNVLLEEGYHRRGVPLETLTALTATNPAKRFGLYPRKGTIAPGSDADLVLVDLDAPWTLRREDLYYRHPHSPFIGRTFRGKILATLLRGKPVYWDPSLNKLMREFGSGRFPDKPFGRFVAGQHG